MYSIVVKDSDGVEFVIASIERINNTMNVQFDIPELPRKPFWYSFKEYLTPLLVAFLVARPFRR